MQLPMRPSPLRHTLAVLRQILGLGQKEMAALIGCSRPTIQAIELGKLKLSDKLGDRIREQTHISLLWLMKNDVHEPPISTHEKPYTKAIFEEVQSRLRNPTPRVDDLSDAANYFGAVVSQIAATLVSAYEQNKLALCQYRLMTYNQHLFDDFGESEKFLNAIRKSSANTFENIRTQFIVHIG